MILSKQDLISLTEQGLSSTALARICGCSRQAITKRLVLYAKHGEFNYLSISSRATQSRVSDEKLKCLYTSGLGIFAIAKELCISENTVRLRLRGLNLLDRSRMCLPSGLSRRTRRPKSSEFSNSTKRKRFLEEHGICEQCFNIIGDGLNFMQACYHHRILIKNGGTSDKGNCEVLHRRCHEEHFQELHGFSRQKLIEAYCSVSQR
jgi:hypothetical protein